MVLSLYEPLLHNVGNARTERVMSLFPELEKLKSEGVPSRKVIAVMSPVSNTINQVTGSKSSIPFGYQTVRHL